MHLTRGYKNSYVNGIMHCDVDIDSHRDGLERIKVLKGETYVVGIIERGYIHSILGMSEL